MPEHVFDQMVARLDRAEADVLKELDRRLTIARGLMQKHVPGADEPRGKDYAELLFEFFERVDDFLDSLDDDDDDDEDDD